MWTDRWIGLGYEERGRGPRYDCMGLFLALYAHRHGVWPPDPACTLREAVRPAVAAQMRPRFLRVDEAREGDALLFRARERLLHVGYVLDGRDMLHIEKDAIGSIVEQWDRPFWKARLEGIYRFVG